MHIQKSAGVSGAERHLLALLPGLAGSGIEVAMCVLAGAGGERFADRLRNAGVPTTTVTAGPHVNPFASAQVARIVRRLTPDLVHTHLFHADVHGWLATRPSKVPVVSSVHGRPGFYRRQPFLGIGRAVGRRVAARIAISEAVRDFLQELGLGVPSRTHVVPYGIDVTGWRAGVDEVARSRRRFGLSEDEVAVGIASRLIAHKGHDLLIDAFVEAKKFAPRLKLLVAGDGPLRRELEAKAAAAGASGERFLGFVDDIRAFMWACDVVAFPAQPALGEGFGLAALEAMAAGRPVVATPTGALAGLVDDGRAGLLVSADSPRQLAEALVELALDPQRRAVMGEAAQQHVATNYSIGAMVEGTASVYRSALTRR